MVKLKVSEECILCGACTTIEGSKFEIGDEKAIAKGDYSEDKAKEIIEICPVNAIKRA